MIIRLHDAVHVLESLNEALSRISKPEDRALHMIRSVQQLLARDAACELWLVNTASDGFSASQVLRRFSLDSLSNGQQVMSKPVLNGSQTQAVLLHLLQRPDAVGRVPATLVITQDGGDTLHDLVTQAADFAYCDAMFAAWGSTPGRMAILGIFRKTDEPAFTANERALLALNLRAITPVVDGSLFRGQQILRDYDLTPRQEEVLMLMLEGASEKEMAEHMHRSLHTVHTYVKQLYTLFNVSSRGELMSRFIERRVVFDLEGIAEHNN